MGKLAEVAGGAILGSVNMRRMWDGGEVVMVEYLGQCGQYGRGLEVLRQKVVGLKYGYTVQVILATSTMSGTINNSIKHTLIEVTVTKPNLKKVQLEEVV